MNAVVLIKKGKGSTILYLDARKIGARQRKSARAESTANDHQPTQSATIAEIARAIQIGASQISRLALLVRIFTMGVTISFLYGSSYIIRHERKF